MNEFDPIKHEYKISGRPVPSVTRVLGDLIPCYHASEWHMERGRAVHACAAMIAKGIEFEHDPQIDGQVRAVRKFFAEVKPVVCEVEKSVYSHRNMYAGTLDLLTRVPGGVSLMVLDWKASLALSVPYQLAAYALAFEDEGHRAINLGVGVEIHEDGTYRMSDVYNLRRYKAGFLALLGAWNIRRECKIKEVTE